MPNMRPTDVLNENEPDKISASKSLLVQFWC